MGRATGVTDGGDVVGMGAGVLRVVQEIVEPAAELEFVAFLKDVEALEEGEIDVVDGVEVGGIAAAGGHDALGCL